MEIFFFVVPLLVLIGSLMGAIAFLRIDRLSERIRKLEREMGYLRSARETTQVPDETGTERHEHPAVAPEETARETSAADAVFEKQPGDAWLPGDSKASGEGAESGWSMPEHTGPDWTGLLRQHWMVVLGGVCLVLAGVFLVRYSIEHGLLGPVARVVLGLLFGVALIASGEFLRITRRQAAGVHAALVASGMLVTYSTILVSYHLYALISPQFAFISLALMSAFAMLLAVKHGPLMAAMGLLGAYLVPVLVRTGSNNIEAALLYSLVVTCSSFWLQRYVYRNWLWWGTWAGAAYWLMLSFDMPGQA